MVHMYPPVRVSLGEGNPCNVPAKRVYGLGFRV